MSVNGLRMTDAAVQLVEENIDQSHPSVVKDQLAQQVRKMLRDQVDRYLIRDGLREWDSRPGSPPGFLPHIVSDVIRRYRTQYLEDKARKEAISNWEKQLKKEMGE